MSTTSDRDRRLRCFQTAQVLSAKNSVYTHPVAGSLLQTEDSIMSGLPVSLSAYLRDLLAVSLECLTTLAQSVDESGLVPIYASYPLIRGALESLSAAFYLLDINTTGERIGRALGIFRSDVSKERDALDALLKIHEAKGAASKARFMSETYTPSLNNHVKIFRVIDTIAQTHTIRVVGGLNTTDLTAYAGNNASWLKPDDSHKPVYYWKLLSGISHGKSWAFSKTSVNRRSGVLSGNYLLGTVETDSKLVTETLELVTSLLQDVFAKYHTMSGRPISMQQLETLITNEVAYSQQQGTK